MNNAAQQLSDENTRIECCSVIKIVSTPPPQSYLSAGQLSGISISIPTMPQAAQCGWWRSNGTWQGWWSFLIQGIRQPGQQSSWSIKGMMLHTMASMFKVSGWLRGRTGSSHADSSVTGWVSSHVTKGRNIYFAGILLNKCNPYLSVDTFTWTIHIQFDWSHSD